jgi:hypothetical protein
LVNQRRLIHEFPAYLCVPDVVNYRASCQQPPRFSVVFGWFLVRIFVRKTIILTGGLLWVLFQIFQANAGVELQIKPKPFLMTVFPIHYFLKMLIGDAVSPTENTIKETINKYVIR